jgi:hypothetical protein
MSADQSLKGRKVIRSRHVPARWYACQTRADVASSRWSTIASALDEAGVPLHSGHAWCRHGRQFAAAWFRAAHSNEAYLSGGGAAKIKQTKVSVLLLPGLGHHEAN